MCIRDRYAFGYNLIADIWNFIATFAEFFANVFVDPIGSIERLFLGLADSVLGGLETIANAIDAVFGSSPVSYTHLNAASSR